MRLSYRVIYNRMRQATNHSLGFGYICGGCTLPLGNGERGRQLIDHRSLDGMNRVFMDRYSHDNDLCYEMMKDIYVSTTTKSNSDGIS